MYVKMPGRNPNRLQISILSYGCVKRFCYLGDTLDGDGGRILLLQLELEMDG